MKTNHIIRHTLAALPLAATLLCTSCELEMSGNGKLDGYWHLEAVDTLSTSGRLDLKEDRRFWSFQNKLMQLNDPSGAHRMCVMYFVHDDGTLSISEPRINDRTQSDPLITDIEILAPYGINAFDESFVVGKLTGGKMELLSPTLRLSFTKF